MFTLFIIAAILCVILYSLLTTLLFYRPELLHKPRHYRFARPNPAPPSSAHATSPPSSSPSQPLAIKLRHCSHRGGAGERIENTIAAFDHAVHDLHTNMLELDCQLTRDGHVVISHDNELFRTAYLPLVSSTPSFAAPHSAKPHTVASSQTFSSSNNQEGVAGEGEGLYTILKTPPVSPLPTPPPHSANHQTNPNQRHRISEFDLCELPWLRREQKVTFAPPNTWSAAGCYATPPPSATPASPATVASSSRASGRGSAMSEQYNREIPTLRSVFERFPHTFVNIDLKESQPELLLEVDRLIREFGRARLTAWGSISEETCRRCAALNPRVLRYFSLRATFWMLAAYYTSLLAWIPLRCDLLEIPYFPAILQLRPSSTSDSSSSPSAGWKWYQRALIRLCHAILNRPALFAHLQRRGIQVIYWVCNSEADVRGAFEAGVDGVMSDYPTMLRRVIAELDESSGGGATVMTRVREFRTSTEAELKAEHVERKGQMEKEKNEDSEYENDVTTATTVNSAVLRSVFVNGCHAQHNKHSNINNIYNNYNNNLHHLSHNHGNGHVKS